MPPKSFKILATCAFLSPDQQALCKNCPLIKMEMDATPDPALPQPPADLTSQQKLAVAIPERTEEDEQRLFRVYKSLHPHFGPPLISDTLADRYYSIYILFY